MAQRRNADIADMPETADPAPAAEAFWNRLQPAITEMRRRRKLSRRAAITGGGACCWPRWPSG
ncbi:hypothetical protein [Paracoccus sp. AS002]|uniref:hypothetical protein n=1 Tax=Paracoccus sp. AS002 TaxID=3019545 RepID=UPI0023E8F790|nr:hypothetical protein [Paracoccus sp. AS002]MDF3906304.1 hypothetical protein [Paracoccus sp. AS002]